VSGRPVANNLLATIKATIWGIHSAAAVAADTQTGRIDDSVLACPDSESAAEPAMLPTNHPAAQVASAVLIEIETGREMAGPA